MIKLNVPLLLVLISGFNALIAMEDQAGTPLEGSTDSSGFVEVPGNPTSESIPTPPPLPIQKSQRNADLKGKEKEDIRDAVGSTLEQQPRKKRGQDLAGRSAKKPQSTSLEGNQAPAAPRASFFNVYRSVLGCVVGGGLLFTLYYYLTQPKPEPLEDIDLVDIEIE